ncbi:MAG TPA: S-layer homology domain-containing protein [Candidatus Aphodoplasma excrementigallinarum]|uniref:S-layer homology domain-containing protein n=1 Tax=Candidatus Aphodoplasma excrementigallinarum TaxID=2840673 RepID=A0A9D1NHL7_9FIRM|nr:S-layer homology domain-containing protein [Candidatus Aphodoplasma excrementigallinarum]
MAKKVISMLLCVLLVLGTFGVPAFAQDGDTAQSALVLEGVDFLNADGSVARTVQTGQDITVKAAIHNTAASGAEDAIVWAGVYRDGVLQDSSRVAAQSVAAGALWDAELVLTDLVAGDSVTVYFWTGTDTIVTFAAPAYFPSNDTEIMKLFIDGERVAVSGDEVSYEAAPAAQPEATFIMRDSATKVVQVTPAAEIPGDAVYRLTSSDGTTRDFTVHYSLLDEYVVRASGIQVNGEAVEDFNANRKIHIAQVPYDTTSATVSVTPANADATVSYEPSATVNPHTTPKVTVTLTSADGLSKNEYIVYVRAVSLTPSSQRDALVENTGANEIRLASYLVGDTEDGTQGAYINTDMRTAGSTYRFGPVGATFANLTHVINPYKDADGYWRNDDTYKGAGGWMYRNRYVYFTLQAAQGGTLYVALTGESTRNYAERNWELLPVDTTLPEGYTNWYDVPIDHAVTQSNPNLLVKNIEESRTGKQYTHIYTYNFSAGAPVPIYTQGISGNYDAAKIMIRFDDPEDAAESNNTNLMSLGYQLDGADEVTPLEILDSQTVRVPATAAAVELAYETEDPNASGAQSPAGAVALGDEAVTLTLTVTAEDGTTKNYTVTFEKEKPVAEPEATAILVNGTELENFVAERRVYEAQVDYGTTEATVELRVPEGVNVSYSPSATINPMETTTVTATLSAADGGQSVYTINVRAITITPGSTRDAFLTNTGTNKLKLATYQMGETWTDSSYVSPYVQEDGVWTADPDTSHVTLVTDTFGGYFNGDLQTGNNIRRIGLVGSAFEGLTHVLTPYKDCDGQWKNNATYKDAGGWMYRNRYVYFTFQAAKPGRVYAALVGAPGRAENFNGWTAVDATAQLPEGYAIWSAVPEDNAVVAENPYLLIRENYQEGTLTTAQQYTHIYYRDFDAGESVSVYTAGQNNSYNSMKVMFDWDVQPAAESNNTNLTSLGYQLDGADEVTPLEIMDSQTVRVPATAAAVELAYETEAFALANTAIAAENTLTTDAYKAGDDTVPVSGITAAETVVDIVVLSGERDAAELLAYLRTNEAIPAWLGGAGGTWSDADGTFSREIKLRPTVPSGLCTVLSSDGGTTTFQYIQGTETISVLKAIINAANNNDADAMVEALAGLDKLDGGNVALFNQLSAAGKAKAGTTLVGTQALKRDTDSVTLDDMGEIVAVVNSALVLPAFNDGVADSVDLYETDICPPETLETDLLARAMDDYKTGLTDAGKKAVLAGISGKAYDSMDALREGFIEQVILQLVSSPKNGAADIAQAVTDYTGITNLELSTYNNLPDAYKNSVLTQLNSAKPDTIEKLASTFASLVATAYTQSQSGTLRPGNSSGGPSYGGGFTVPAGPTPAPSTPTPPVDSAPSTNDYSDANDAAWATAAMQEMLDREIWVGYEDKTLRPNNNVSREEAYKMLVAAFVGVDAGARTDFTDVTDPGAWFYPYIATAQQRGLTVGMGDGTFGIGQEITRQDLAVMFYNYLVAQNKVGAASSDVFTDDAQVADYAKEAVYVLRGMGVLSGYDDGSFQPEGRATRAEMAQMMYNLFSVIE